VLAAALAVIVIDKLCGLKAWLLQPLYGHVYSLAAFTFCVIQHFIFFICELLGGIADSISSVGYCNRC